MNTRFFHRHHEVKPCLDESADYSNEGKLNKYSCRECRQPCYRSDFLIEMTDATGQLAPGLDFQGFLPGRCYKCCRGDGPSAAAKDMFEEKVKRKVPESQIYKEFKKECKLRHIARQDVKENDVKRLRTAKFADLLNLMKNECPDASNSKLRAMVVTMIEKTVKKVVNFFQKTTEETILSQKFERIMTRYAKIKEAEKEMKDEEGIVIPGGEFSHECQFLSKISVGVDRYYICRNKDCNPEGNYFGLNTDWISTIEDGGWHFMCPVCGRQYNPGNKTNSSFPFHHIWVMQDTENENKYDMFLSAWAASAEEDTIVRLMQMLSEKDLQPWREMPREEVQAAVTIYVKQNAIPTYFKKMTLTQQVKLHVVNQNAMRTKQKKWGYKAIEDGFYGSYFKFEEGVTPIMTEEDTKAFLAGMYVLMCEQKK